MSAKQFLKDWIGKGVRSAPFQAVRDTALNAAGLGLHEKLFLQSMTGGRRDGLTQLPESTLGQLKGASDERDLARMSVEKVAPWGKPPLGRSYFPLSSPQRPEGGNLSLYGRGADLHLGLGNVQATKDDSGNVRVKDIWDVDHTPWEDEAIARGEKPVMRDLIEGGPLASRIYHFARRLGTYEPINVDINIPSKKWKGIEGELAPEGYPMHSRVVGAFKDRPPKEPPGKIGYDPKGVIGGNSIPAVQTPGGVDWSEVLKQKSPSPNGFPSNSFLP